MPRVIANGSRPRDRSLFQLRLLAQQVRQQVLEVLFLHRVEEVGRHRREVGLAFFLHVLAGNADFLAEAVDERQDAALVANLQAGDLPAVGELQRGGAERL